jgi:hypothetical protein
MDEIGMVVCVDVHVRALLEEETTRLTGVQVVAVEPVVPDPIAHQFEPPSVATLLRIGVANR